MTDPKTCKGPECDREAAWAGLCPAHYMQKKRHGKMVPLRVPGNGKRMVGLRLTPEAAEAVADDYPGAVAAVERWAKRRP